LAFGFFVDPCHLDFLFPIDYNSNRENDMDDAAGSIDITKLKSLSFEIGAIRPPSEGGSFSLLLRTTRNCPWSRCTFCYGQFYNRERFQLRTVGEIKSDIDTIKAIADELSALSWKLGLDGKLAPVAGHLSKLLLEGKDASELSTKEFRNVHCVINVYNWLVSGARSVFLQDADSPIMYTDQLAEAIRYLKYVFPDIARVTSYARSKTLARKNPDELKQLFEAGLSRLHIGLETGDDELLAHVNKGVTAAEHILAGKKGKAAGFALSTYVMPGLGGRAFWRQHAVNTARVLGEIDPDYIRMRPLVPMSGTPLLAAYENGEFELTTPLERLQEIKLMVEHLNVTSRLSFDQVTNTNLKSGENLVPLFRQDYEGYKFPEEKEKVLEICEEGLRLDERAFFDVKAWVGTKGL
jgi:radical SAM superfamily enzyme YgiQ (UPF0313 family)